LLPDQFKKTGDLDIIDQMKSLGLLLDKYKKTCDLDIVEKIKLRGLLLDKFNKTGDLGIADIINLRGLLGERHQYRQHMFISWPLNFKIKFDTDEDFARKYATKGAKFDIITGLIKTVVKNRIAILQGSMNTNVTITEPCYCQWKV